MGEGTERGRAAAALYHPPAPPRRAPLAALAAASLRALLTGERDLLSLLPAAAYEMRVGRLGPSRRGIYLVNDPALIRRVLVEEVDAFPKNDLFVGALEPLIGDGVFISAGETWRAQRRMIDPSFTHIRVDHAFVRMRDGVDALIARLDANAHADAPIALDAEISHGAADVITRAVFSRPLADAAAGEVFAAFAAFQDRVANVRIDRLLLGRPGAAMRQPIAARAAARRIRRLLTEMVRARRADGDAADLAGDLFAARDPADGVGFSDEALIDQLAVFFLAGHETTASAVTWAVFILSQDAAALTRLRAEIDAAGPLTLAAVKSLTLTRAALKETLRLYPPATFLPRSAARRVRLGPAEIPAGAMVMISPWTLHRHRALWSNPDAFDLDRFAPDAPPPPRDAYLPFGLGPRACVGASFALTEGALMLARIIARYDVIPLAPTEARPAAKLTTRMASAFAARLRLRPRHAPDQRIDAFSADVAPASRPASL